MIYHLVLEEEHGVLVLRLGHRRLSIAYALGPGVMDAQWHDMNDADMEGMLTLQHEGVLLFRSLGWNNHPSWDWKVKKRVLFRWV